MADLLAPAIVVGKPGPLRDSLAQLLVATQRLEAVWLTEDSAGAATLLRRGDPALVVMAESPSDERSWQLVKRTKRTRPAIPWIVLASDAGEAEQAKAAGVDRVPWTGAPALQLWRVVNELLGVDCACPDFRDTPYGDAADLTGAVRLNAPCSSDVSACP
jgi:DNA-binding NarL/FixJ family response regulator